MFFVTYTTSNLVAFDFMNFNDDVFAQDAVKVLIHNFGSDELKTALRNLELNSYCHNQLIVMRDYKRSVQNELNKIAETIKRIYPLSNPHFTLNDKTIEHLVVELTLKDILLIKYTATTKAAKLVVATLNSTNDPLDDSLLNKIVAIVNLMAVPIIDEKQAMNVTEVIKLYIPLET